MRSVKVTKFGDFDDPIKMTKQLAESVNAIENVLSKMPFYFGEVDPNGQVIATAGSMYLRTGLQGENQAVSRPYWYIKTIDGGTSGWLSLFVIGQQDSTEVTASPGSIYVKTDGTTATLYFKQTDSATPTGWQAL